MTTYRVDAHGAMLEDLDAARSLGRRLWEESDLQLDFGGVEGVTPQFAAELCRTIVTRRSPAVLSNAFLVGTMTPEVQATFLPAIMGALGATVPEPPAGPDQPTPVREPAETATLPLADLPLAGAALDPFEILEEVQQQYLTYVRTFQQFQNPEIRDWVLERVHRGTLLWKPPFIQISRPFASGDALADLVAEGLLHPATPPVFRWDAENPASAPVQPYRHQTEAVRSILGECNVVVATGTGSGKSFAFGIPIISEALRMRDQRVQGIKALIVYPMNALANSQYDDFARRLHRSGLSIALYTGDTAHSPTDALDRYQRATGRDQPYDSEVLSREAIQQRPPDILMTNYVMLELLLTRFDDRRLFATPGVLRFLVLDEVHTYTGKRGADVACLIRRLKQHTDTTGKLRCIATSATVEASSPVQGGTQSAAAAVAGFASRLFGEPFRAEDVVTEHYAPLPVDLPPITRAITEALTEGPRTVPQLAHDLDVPPDAIQQALLQRPASDPQSLAPKLHAFFSQGRAITACLDPSGPHLNDRGEITCPVCAQEGQERPTFPLVFCRACGQEYWSVAVDREGHLHPAELDAVDVSGRPGYLLAGHQEVSLPEHWLTPKGQVRGGKGGYQDVVPAPHSVCPSCGRFDSDCAHEQHEIIFLPAPFLYCPNCAIVHDRRSREYNKLFIFGSVGRSTATDVLVSSQVQALPRDSNKVIAFSDNRQDTALQAAHMQSLHNRIAFRQALFTALREGKYLAGQASAALANVGGLLYEAQKRHGVVPEFRISRRIFGRDQAAEGRYQRYLDFVTLWELGGTHRRTHQNLEDVGLLAVGYHGLDECAGAPEFWADVNEMAGLDADIRFDILVGLLDLMRKRLALRDGAILAPYQFESDIISKINEEAHIHDEAFRGPVGYSDTAERGYGYRLYRLTGTNTQPVVWIKRALEALQIPLAHADAIALVTKIVGKLADPRAEFLVRHTVKGFGNRRYDLWMVNPSIIALSAGTASEHWRCPKCGTVHHFRALRVCTGTTCRTTLDRQDLETNYFRQVYTTPLGEAVPIRAEEHSGQVSGEERREIELRFRNEEDPLNVLICTPTMELGIDIGHLNAVTLRNVPPSPSNYAQRAGRAGRSGQASLIAVFAGVGSSRGPHDQYFYRFPQKMIAGAIAAPRFRLDNQTLIRAHVHSLVLETMGLKGAERLPGRPSELIDLEREGFPLYLDWAAAYRAGIKVHLHTILTAVAEAFAPEMERLPWLDSDFIEKGVQGFVDSLDQAMDRWRREYERLDEELEELNRLLGHERVDPSMNRRRVVVEGKRQAMREGQGDWYLYRYLGGEGFLPGYAFPPQATVLSFDDREEELARDPAIALTEYAPGNFVYYRGQRYEVTHARPRTREMQPDVERVLVCPACGRAYLGAQETQRAACRCGQDLMGVHPRDGLALCDMFARRRARITADEEERLRLGYELTKHYMAGGNRAAHRVSARSGVAFGLTIEHDGQVLLLNQGARQQDGEPRGFTLCARCHRWLMSEDAEQAHISTPTKRGKCPRDAANAETDLLRGLWLTQTLQSDLALLDVPMPPEHDQGLADGKEPERFYTTLMYTWLRGLMVALNLGESELDAFLAPGAEEGIPHRIVLYETAVGGSGVLASLAESGRLGMVVARARELLHEGDPEGGCEKACYDCLLSFYNQRDHERMDRRLVLPWFQALEELDVEPEVAEDEFSALEIQCQSDLERQVLRAIQDRGVPLPDAAQETLYDRDGSPLAVVDFFYRRGRIAVFVDGSPHHRDYVQAADEQKRRRLRALGYRIVVARGEEPETGLHDLAERLAL
jgi:superfamily II DNA or RNA helicase